jgi:hypothetical protein
MTPARDVVLHVALVIPDGRFYGHSVRIPPEQWATSASHIRDVESWLEGASRAVLDQLRDDGMQ